MSTRFFYAASTDSGGAPQAAPAPEMILQTLPSGQTPETEEVDYFIEGSPEAQAAQEQSIAGKSREEIYAELQKAQEAIVAEKAKADPVSALTDTLSKFLQPQAAPAKPIVPGYLQQPSVLPGGQPNPYSAETPEQRKARYTEKWLADPDGAAREVMAQAQAELAASVAQNQAQLSREMIITNPETKKYYDRYATEVEEVIAKMTPLERFQNPRMYQSALEQVKARHSDELIQESLQAKIDEAVNAKLAAMGLSATGSSTGSPTGVAKTAVAPVPTGAGGLGQRPATGPRRAEIIPRWVVETAERQGSDPKFLFQHYKEQGVIH